MSHFTDFTGYVVFIITSFLAGVESPDQCLRNSKVLSCFSGVIMSIRSFFLFTGQKAIKAVSVILQLQKIRRAVSLSVGCVKVIHIGLISATNLK